MVCRMKRKGKSRELRRFVNANTLLCYYKTKAVSPFKIRYDGCVVVSLRKIQLNTIMIEVRFSFLMKLMILELVLKSVWVANV